MEDFYLAGGLRALLESTWRQARSLRAITVLGKPLEEGSRARLLYK